MIEKIGRHLLGRIEEPLVGFLVALRLTPNVLTGIGLFLAAATSYIIADGHLRAGGLLFLLTSAIDSLDGMLARKTGRVTKFGSCLDSTFDRLSEAIVMLGLLVFLQRFGPLHLDLIWSLPLVYATMAGSLAVSYVKARAEGLGFDCKTGWMQRSERIAVLGIAMGFGVVDFVLIPLVLLLIITIWQRMALVADQESQTGGHLP